MIDGLNVYNLLLSKNDKNKAVNNEEIMPIISINGKVISINILNKELI